jgi:hypothetical protein
MDGAVPSSYHHKPLAAILSRQPELDYRLEIASQSGLESSGQRLHCLRGSHHKTVLQIMTIRD